MFGMKIDELLKHLKEMVADSPYKNPFIWALIPSSLVGYYSFNLKYYILFAIFLISAICFSLIFEVAFPKIKNIHKSYREKKQAEKDERKLKRSLCEISDEQKKIIATFFPHPKAPKFFDDHCYNFALIDLIENKILLLIGTCNCDYNPHAWGAKVILTEYAIDFIGKNNLLESWQEEGSLEEEKIDSLPISDPLTKSFSKKRAFLK